MLGVDMLGLMLPHVAQCGDEYDIAAVRPGVIGDELHLFEEHRVRIELEALGGLMGVIDVILRVGDRGDRETGFLRHRRSGKQGGRGEQGKSAFHGIGLRQKLKRNVAP